MLKLNMTWPGRTRAHAGNGSGPESRLMFIGIVYSFRTGRYAGGQQARVLYSHPLGATAFTGKQLNLTFRDPKLPGQKADQLAVGLAVDRRCGQSDLQAFAMTAVKCVQAGPGLHLHGQYQVISIPAVKRYGQQEPLNRSTTVQQTDW